MNLRKTVLSACIVILLVMFTTGVFVLSDASAFTKPKPYSQQKMQTKQEESAVQQDLPVNLLLLGLDQEGLRTDTILLLNFDPGTSNLNILSVERDTQVMVDDRTCKINALYAMGGEDYLRQIIKEMTGLTVDYYATMDFKGFRNIIDVLEGVRFEVPINMNYDDPTQDLHIHLNKGLQLLDGSEAEQLVRYRKGNRPGEGYVEGDVGRIRTQQKFVKELITQKLKLRYLSKIDELFAVLEENVKTNIGINDVQYYLGSLTRLNADSIHTFTMPGDSSYEDGIWYFFYNEKKTLEMIQRNFSKE